MSGEALKPYPVGTRGYVERDEFDRRNPDVDDWATVTHIHGDGRFDLKFDSGSFGHAFDRSTFKTPTRMVNPFLHASDRDYSCMLPVDPLEGKPKPYVPRHRLEYWNV